MTVFFVGIGKRRTGNITRGQDIEAINIGDERGSLKGDRKSDRVDILSIDRGREKGKLSSIFLKDMTWTLQCILWKWFLFLLD